MAPVVRSATTSLVLIGSFNPAVFHPRWFGQHELLPAEQVAEASESVQAVGSNFLTFEAGWLAFQAIPLRCAFTAAESAYQPDLRDLVIGTLSLLPETPVWAVGFNRDVHFRVSSEDEWHAIGDRFVPNEPWVELTGGERAGLRRLIVDLGRRDGHEGELNVELGPSLEVQPNGVYLGVNDHLQLGSSEDPVAAADALPVIEAVWDAARSRANNIARHTVY